MTKISKFYTHNIKILLKYTVALYNFFSALHEVVSMQETCQRFELLDNRLMHLSMHSLPSHLIYVNQLHLKCSMIIFARVIIKLKPTELMA